MRHEISEIGYNERMDKRCKYSPEFKAKVVLELIGEQMTLHELAAKHGVSPVIISRWKKEFKERAPELFEKGPSAAEKELRKKAEYVEELEKKLGQAMVERDYLKKKSDEVLGPGWKERTGYARKFGDNS
jgi:putative transposase